MFWILLVHYAWKITTVRFQRSFMLRTKKIGYGWKNIYMTKNQYNL